MADRTSARIFGLFFNHLAKNPTEENITLAKELTKELTNYDFSLYQMDADEALITLGLAKIQYDEKWDEDEIIYLF
jgi:hypothetical protein